MAGDAAASHPFDIDEIVAHAVAAAAAAAQDKGLEFVVHRSREIPAMLLGDGIRLGQVLSRLVHNAVRFTAAGEISLAVDCEHCDAAHSSIVVRFSVNDTGTGVDEETAALFAASPHDARGDADARSSGLVAVRSLLRSLGGTMAVASAPGVGSDFSFSVRFGAVAGATTAATPDFAGLPVLIVDDCDTARMALQHLLEAANCKVVAASDAAEALERLAAAASPHFRLAIVDAAMPGMDGLELVRCICGAARDPRLPAMLMVTPSRQGEVASLARRQAIPVADYLIKPIVAAPLYRAVGALVRTADCRLPPAADALPIDEAAALGRLGGNRDLLDRLLAEFRNAEADAASSVEQSIAAHRLEEAARRVHTAKGTAMILGLDRFAGVACLLDHALRQQNADAAAALLPSFAHELGIAIAACAPRRDPAPPEERAATPAATPGADVLQPLIERLRSLLVRSSMAALDPARRLAESLAGTRHAGTAAEFDDVLNRLDFAAARACLDKLENELGTKGG